MDARDLYTRRLGLYALWMSLFRHEQALQSLFDRSGILAPKLRILDAGCGSGATTFALIHALRKRHLEYRAIDAFDLTRAMLDRFRSRLDERGIRNVQLIEADVLQLESLLPETWKDYDLIVSASMLEYVPNQRLSDALSALRRRLLPGGSFLLVITKKNLLSRFLIQHAWKTSAHTAPELESAMRAAGFTDVRLSRFPLSHFWMNSTNHVVLARAAIPDI